MNYFIAVPFEFRDELAPSIGIVKQVLDNRGDLYEVFVDRFLPEEMPSEAVMNCALDMVAEADGLIAEMTHKAVGVAGEMGVARSRGIPITGIRRKGSPPSRSYSGMAKRIIDYVQPDEIAIALPGILDNYTRETLSETDRDILVQADVIVEAAEEEAATLLVKSPGIKMDSKGEAYLQAYLTRQIVLKHMEEKTDDFELRRQSNIYSEINLATYQAVENVMKAANRLSIELREKFKPMGNINLIAQVEFSGQSLLKSAEESHRSPGEKR